MSQSERFKAKLATLQNNLDTIDNNIHTLQKRGMGNQTPSMIAAQARRLDVVNQITAAKRLIPESQLIEKAA